MEQRADSQESSNLKVVSEQFGNRLDSVTSKDEVNQTAMAAAKMINEMSPRDFTLTMEKAIQHDYNRGMNFRLAQYDAEGNISSVSFTNPFDESGKPQKDMNSIVTVTRGEKSPQLDKINPICSNKVAEFINENVSSVFCSDYLKGYRGHWQQAGAETGRFWAERNARIREIP